MKTIKVAAVISLLGLGLAMGAGVGSATEVDAPRVYASYASPHASQARILPYERASVGTPVIAPAKTPAAGVQGAQVSTSDYVSAHLLAVGQYRGEEDVAQRAVQPDEKG